MFKFSKFWERSNKVATPAAQKYENKTIFDFIFNHIELFLLFGMAFMVYAVFNTFTNFISQKALFMDKTDRLEFAQTLIFGLMFVEILLALATSFFRKRDEWAKSILVTAIALIIAYYNHHTINQIFLEFPDAEAVKIKLVLANWLIFGLGEVVSLLMNSKGKDASEPSKENYLLNQLEKLISQNAGTGTSSTPTTQLFDSTGQKIGFQMQAEPTKTEVRERKPRGKSVDYQKIFDCLDKGLSIRQTATVCKCSENTVQRAKKERNS